MVGLKHQGPWIKWEILANLHVRARANHHLALWAQEEDPLEHILSSCRKKALAGGCDPWRHDQVLKAVAETVATAITVSKPRKNITFVKVGGKTILRPSTATGALGSSADWSRLWQAPCCSPSTWPQQPSVQTRPSSPILPSRLS